MIIKAPRAYRLGGVKKVAKVNRLRLVIFASSSSWPSPQGLLIWKRISYLNIVPLLGVSESPAPLSMVSEWMERQRVGLRWGKYGRQPMTIGAGLELMTLQLLEEGGYGTVWCHPGGWVEEDNRATRFHLHVRFIYSRLGHEPDNPW